MCVAMTVAGSDDLLSLLLKNLQFPFKFSSLNNLPVCTKQTFAFSNSSQNCHCDVTIYFVSPISPIICGDRCP